MCALQFELLMPGENGHLHLQKLRYGQVPGFDHAKVRAKESQLGCGKKIQAVQKMMIDACMNDHESI